MAMKNRNKMSNIKYAEMRIDQAEKDATLFTDDEKNQIVNYAYKTGDRDATDALVQ